MTCPPVPSDADPIAARRALAPDAAAVPGSIDEREPASGIAADAKRRGGAAQFEERGKQAIDEAGPPAPNGLEAVGLELEGDAPDERGDLVVAGRRGRDSRDVTIAGQAADELAQRREPREGGSVRQALWDRHGVVGEEEARTGSVGKMIVVGTVGDDTRVVMAAGAVACVRDDEQVIRWRAGA